MSARLTMFPRALVIGCCVVAFTAVAQDSQQRPDEHHDNGQQRPVEQNAGHNGVNRPEQQQGAQQYRGEHPPDQYQQHQTQQQLGQQNGHQQQYRGEQQQTGQQYQQRDQQTGQQYQQRGDQQQYQQRGDQQQYQQRGDQQHYQQRGDQQQYQQRGDQQHQQHGDQQQYQQRGDQQQYQQRGDQQHYQQRGDQQYTRESNRGQEQYRQENRPQQWGRPPANRPSYNFRPNDRNTLRGYYGSRLGDIDRAHRPAFRIGGYLPYEDLGFFSPVPRGVWGSLPPIPYGYEAGYWDGYVIVYDPNTGYILYVSDLM